MKSVKIIIPLLLFPFLIYSQKEKDPCKTLQNINSLIQEYHYKPHVVDDSLSSYLLNSFLNKLDANNRLFLASEIDTISKHEYEIDDYISNNNCAFLKEIYNVYSNSALRYSKIINELKNEKFSYSSKDKINFPDSIYTFAVNENELKKKISKLILYDVLKEIAEVSNDKDSLVLNFDSLAPKKRLEIFEEYECLSDMYILSQNDFNILFFKEFCNYFDPHSDYFSDTEKSEFYATVSSVNFSFGIQVSLEENGSITVESVVPGSPAYFSSKINSGDKLLKISNKDEEIELSCKTIKKVESLLYSKKFKTCLFTFRKKNGEIYSVNLVKKVIADYENRIYSFLIKKGGQQYGYIKIPSFYSTFENGKSNLSLDMVNELTYLQEDSIDGLIIDVQDNGGGSMDEVQKLSSLFIDEGPIAMVMNNKSKIETISDSLPGAIYKGPLVVMINGNSASASEFFVNVMQDYNRAIIIGNPSFGKATMQRVYPLNSNKDEFIKITLEEFYRVNGKTNQFVSIQPDIEIPALFDGEISRECDYPTAIQNDEISSSSYKYIKNLKYTTAVALGKKRIARSIDALIIKNLNDKLEPFYNIPKLPIGLDFISVFDSVNYLNLLMNEVDKLNKQEYPINVTLNSKDEMGQKKNSYLKIINTDRILEIKRNYHILEAANILFDVNASNP
jgi:carboxyl-terminal processing protease